MGFQISGPGTNEGCAGAAKMLGATAACHPANVPRPAFGRFRDRQGQES